MAAPKSLTLVGEGGKGARIHDLVKAPANTPWVKAKQQSWDGNEPATVYYTPETLADGTPCTAITVILRTKGCHWWWSSGCTFCGYCIALLAPSSGARQFRIGRGRRPQPATDGTARRGTFNSIA